MIENKFRFDFGQGDFIDVVVPSKKEKEYTLNDMIQEVKNSDEWVTFNDTSIQISHIKRIVSLKRWFTVRTYVNCRQQTVKEWFEWLSY